MSAAKAALQIVDIPFSQQAEEAVIGCVFMNPAQFEHLNGLITANDFFYNRHKVIWQAFVDVTNDGMPCDQLLVAERLKAIRKLEEIGGYSYLVQLSVAVESSAYAEVYARVVRQTSIRRQALAAADRIRQAAVNEALRLDDVMSEIDLAVKGVLTSTTANTVYEVSDLASQALDRMEKAVQDRRNGKVLLAGISYGLRDLDATLQGAQPGQYIIICGRPGNGKSVLAVQAAYNFAVQGKRVRFFSTEMTETEVFDRLITSMTGIPFYAHRSGMLDPRQMSQYTQAVGELSKLSITIDSESQARPSYIWRESIKQKERYGLDAIVVDGTYRLKTDGKYSSLYERGDEIATSMKNLARKLQVPLLGTHQIGRAGETRPPMMSDLQDSGRYEQEADVILGMYRDELEGANHQQVYILKQRNSGKGVISLYFAPEQMKFYDATVTTVDLTQ